MIHCLLWHRIRKAINVRYINIKILLNLRWKVVLIDGINILILRVGPSYWLLLYQMTYCSILVWVLNIMVLIWYWKLIRLVDNVLLKVMKMIVIEYVIYLLSGSHSILDIQTWICFLFRTLIYFYFIHHLLLQMFTLISVIMNNF